MMKRKRPLTGTNLVKRGIKADLIVIFSQKIFLLARLLDYFNKKRYSIEPWILKNIPTYSGHRKGGRIRTVFLPLLLALKERVFCCSDRSGMRFFDGLSEQRVLKGFFYGIIEDGYWKGVK